MTPMSKPAFWRSTPPAVFPPVMGLFGVALGWRRAAEAFGTSTAIADLVLGATVMIFLLLFAAYMAKFLARPEVVLEDLRVLPGRAGLAAASLSVMLFAAAMVPYSERLASFLLTVGVLWHMVLAGLMSYVLAKGPAAQRKTTPVWHLSYVGFVVAPLSAVPLGMIPLAMGLFISTIGIAVVIYAISLSQLAQRDPPPPLRPLLAIHLAPLSLFGTIAASVELTGMAICFALLATLVLAIMLYKARYLTAAGFSPLWGAFTFPLAAYGGMMLALASVAGFFGFIGGAVLVAATLITIYIAAKVLQMFVKGSLAKGTNAAIA